MFDKFETWQYRDDANCWDFVREYLAEKAGIPKEDVPQFGICPDDKKAMTKASMSVGQNFRPCTPDHQYAVACAYHGKVLYHVGIVDGGFIRHTGRKRGTVKESIRDFEKNYRKVEYRIHKTLWQSY